MWSRGGDSGNSFPLQPEDDVCCHCCLNHLPQNMLPCSAENGSYHQQCCCAGACLCSQGQKSAWGKVLGSLIPTDLAPPAAFQTWAQEGERVQFLGTTVPLTPWIARDCFSVLNWPFFSLVILISCKKKVFRSVHSKCPWAGNGQAHRG